MSSWFSLAYLPGNETLYQITVDELERLHQPHWPYDENNLTDVVEFIVENNSEHFNAAYKIVAEGGEVNYTCSDAYVFKGSHNITQRAICSNWTWDVLFNETMPCVRKEILNKLFIFYGVFMLQLYFVLKRMYLEVQNFLREQQIITKSYRPVIPYIGTPTERS